MGQWKIRAGMGFRIDIKLENCRTFGLRDLTLGQAHRDFTLVKAAPENVCPDFCPVFSFDPSVMTPAWV